MAVSLGDLTSESLGSSRRFNWTWFIELITSGILALWFLFYFNRLFATLVSYGLRAYAWHKFRVYVEIQALQVSLLGGRLFFKGVRYYGENETVVVHNGHLTWRYWLSSARQVDLQTDNDDLDQTTSKGKSSPESASSEDGEVDEKDQERAMPKRRNKSDARIAISVNGLEWFIYNRSPVYDAIVQLAAEHQEGNGTSTSTTGTSSSEPGEKTSGAKKRRSRTNAVEDDFIADDDSLEDEAPPEKSTASKTREFAQSLGERLSMSTHQSLAETAEITAVHSLMLRFLPVSIECSRGAVSVGNEHTRALIVTTFVKARGHIDASSSGPADIFRQVFDFDVEHPVVRMRPNPDFRLPQMAAAEKIITGKGAVLKRRPWWKVSIDFKRRRRTVSQGLRDMLPMFRSSVESFHGSYAKERRNTPYVPFGESQPENIEWHGLDRYLDETDTDDHYAWMNVEYARFSTMVDCPSVHLVFYWDIPGTVKRGHIQALPTGLAKDVNGIEPPAYGLDLLVRGGHVDYGPWTDRLRQEIQNVFLPASYQSGRPIAPLEAGSTRQNSIMTIRITIEEEITLRIPTRESSKDWKWRGRATAARDAAALRKQQERKHFRFRRSNKSRLAPDVRPFGWMVIKVGRGSTVRYDMDMYAGVDGYRNNLRLDLKNTKATSSVNHETLWDCKKQSVVADLSNPLGWNDLHVWRFDVRNQGMDLFFLRDHAFLLMDLINDFTAGLKSEYMTFIPFEYKIGISFDQLALYLNANDYNIIEKPCDLDDNAFLILGFEELVGQVGVPMQYFSPRQSSVSFRGQGKNGTLTLKTPLWNTLREFAKDEQMMTLKTVDLDGSYNYFASTSPQLTDSLVMNITGGSPKFHLQGPLIRYFMNVKENYFGEDMHFRTLEEYRESVDPENGQLVDDKKPPTTTANDLDVILSIRADQSYALMPANLYERSENVRIDVLLMEADLRITNYYMDMQVNSSPIEVSLERDTKKDGKNVTDISNCQIFIDGISGYGHRLFGAPPTEPTYLCNWDFDVGSISGEFSADFLRVLVAAIQAFVFMMDDEENSLPKLHSLIVPDVTFLRLRTAGLRVWLLSADTAFLLEVSSAKVALNDWANASFSSSIQVNVPQIVAASMDLRCAYRNRDSPSFKVPTSACIKTSVKLAVLNKNAEFAHKRALQQQHLRFHDQRTRRAEWLLHKQAAPQSLSQHSSWSREPPAMPLPEMPEPVICLIPSQTDLTFGQGHGLGVSFKNGSFLSLDSLNLSQSRKDRTSDDPKKSHADSRSPTGRPDLVPSELTSQTAHEEQTSHPGSRQYAERNQSAEVLPFSTPWSAPQFPLQKVNPDLSQMPEPGDFASAVDAREDEDADEDQDEHWSNDNERVKHDGIFCNFIHGISGFCAPEAVQAVAQLINSLMPKSGTSILDALQLSTTSNILELTSERIAQIEDFALRLPYARLRLLSTVPDRDDIQSDFDSYNIDVLNTKITARVAPPKNGHTAWNSGEKDVLLHVAIETVKASASEQGVTQATIADFGLSNCILWLSLQSQIRIRTQLETVMCATAARRVDLLAAFINRTSDTIARISGPFQDLDGLAAAQQLVLHLVSQENTIQDPQFISRPSYVLRSAKEHVRYSDAWKIMSRLRHLWNNLPAEERDFSQARENFVHLRQTQSVQERVGSAFDKWKAWDKTNEATAPILRAIFGTETRVAGQPGHASDLEAEIVLAEALLVLDPGPRQSDFVLESFNFNFSDKPVLVELGTDSSRDFLSKQRKTIQSYSSNIALNLNWELLELVEGLLQRNASEEAPELKVSGAKPAGNEIESLDDFVIVIGTDNASIRAESPNLRLLLGSEKLVSSVMLTKSEGLAMESSVMLRAELARLRLSHKRKTLVSGRLNLPNIYASYQQEQGSSQHPDTARFAASCDRLRFSVKQDILALLRAATSVVQIEARYVQKLTTMFQPESRSKASTRTQPSRLPELHIALFLNDYRLHFALMPYLQYEISGKGARTSVLPLGKSSFTVLVDISEHRHSFDSPKIAADGAVPALVMPPIVGRLTMKIAKDRLMIDGRTAVERIFLEASAARACFDAAYRPETVAYVRGVKADLENLQRTANSIFGAGNPSPTSKALPDKASMTIHYRGFAVLAGVEVHCSAPARRSEDKYRADLRLGLGPLALRFNNQTKNPDIVLQLPQFELNMQKLAVDIERVGQTNQNFGSFTMSMKLEGVTELDEQGTTIQHYRAISNGMNLDMYSETVLLSVDIVTFLRERIESLSATEDIKKMRPLRRMTIARIDERQALETAQKSVVDGNDEDDTTDLPCIDSVFSLDLNLICARWLLNDSATPSPTRRVEDMGFSVESVDFKTKREGSARLAIMNLQLQTVPKSNPDPVQRTANSALLPEMVFNAAYLTTKKDRRLALKAAGKAVDVQLASDFVLPVSALQKSFAKASVELRGAQLSPAEVGPDTPRPSQHLLPKNKRLSSLIMFADFAGAVVTISPRHEEEEQRSSVFGILKGPKRSRAGKYGQAVQSGGAEGAVLRAPGIAWKVEYRDDGEEDPTLSTEIRIAASSNTLAPSVVPLIREISSSVKEILGEENPAPGKRERSNSKLPSPKLVQSQSADRGDPTAILGNVKLNVGLWVQRQEFSLTCQPIARVSATAKSDDIFVTVNTVQSAKQGRFFAIMTRFNNLAASVQHVYSRESTASFEVDSIVVSLMNSRHFSDKSGISVILNIGPMKADVNAKQMQDFLLFREIWYPAELRSVPVATPSPTADKSSQTYAIQRYHEITGTDALPWHAVVSVQELNTQVDFGPSLGKSRFTVSKLWVSSKKTSDSEQDLCAGFDSVGIDSSGRMSGFIELQGFRVRTGIHWVSSTSSLHIPLVQGSVGFQHLRMKAAFDYQPFAIADVSSFDFLMYNVRQGQGKHNDRLVGVLDGGKVQVFCTATTAAQSCAIVDAFQKLIQEKQAAYESSLQELDRLLRRRSTYPAAQWASTSARPPKKTEWTLPTALHTDVVITLQAIDLGVFPNTFFDQQILKVDAVDVEARFAVNESDSVVHSGLGMQLGQVRVALSSVGRTNTKALGELSIPDIIERATSSKGGTILKVPKLVASMETWQRAHSQVIEYIFRSTFQGKVDVGWNLSRISFIRSMWETHSKALAQRLDRPLPPSAIKITTEPQVDASGRSGPEKITAVVHVPQSKYEYVALEPPVIDTPQLRDLGEATPSLEWIGLHREKLPNVTHSVIIVSLLELAKEVEDAYTRILGTG